MTEDILSCVPALRFFAFALCERNCDSDELVAETLQAAIERIDEYEPDQNVRIWLYSLMQDVFHDAAGARPWEPVETGAATGGADFLAGLDPPTQSLFEALANLPERYRVVLVLVGILGEEMADVATLIGSEPDILSARLALGRDLLEEELPKSGTGRREA